MLKCALTFGNDFIQVWRQVRGKNGDWLVCELKLSKAVQLFCEHKSPSWIFLFLFYQTRHPTASKVTNIGAFRVSHLASDKWRHGLSFRFCLLKLLPGVKSAAGSEKSNVKSLRAGKALEKWNVNIELWGLIIVWLVWKSAQLICAMRELIVAKEVQVNTNKVCFLSKVPAFFFFKSMPNKPEAAIPLAVNLQSQLFCECISANERAVRVCV